MKNSNLIFTQPHIPKLELRSISSPSQTSTKPDTWNSEAKLTSSSSHYQNAAYESFHALMFPTESDLNTFSPRKSPSPSSSTSRHSLSISTPSSRGSESPKSSSRRIRKSLSSRPGEVINPSKFGYHEAGYDVNHDGVFNSLRMPIKSFREVIKGHEKEKATCEIKELIEFSEKRHNHKKHEKLAIFGTFSIKDLREFLKAKERMN